MFDEIRRVAHEPVDLASKSQRQVFCCNSSASYNWLDPFRLVIGLGRILTWAPIVAIGLFYFSVRHAINL